MSYEFDNRGIVHNVQAKFFPAYLPEAKKPYNLRTAHQQELTIKDVAEKAGQLNSGISPQAVENGLNAGMQVIARLVADGYKIKLPLCTIKIKLPGEYEGRESSLPPDVYPIVSLQTSAQFQKYIREMVNVEFDGKLETEGFIANAVDEATGLTDESATRGNVLTIRGLGLKIAAEEAKKDRAGLYFMPESGAPIKADIIAVNEPRTLKVVVPTTLKAGESYRLAIQTQSSARSSSTILKELRDMQSDFTVTVL